ncbi:MAG: class I SAM-dependent methyltransferase [Gammaproteobacteria bacterium]
MTQRDMNGQSPAPTATYSLGHDAAAAEAMAVRHAASEAAFLLPHLTPGMSLLDCGCGPGSITLGLARQVAPGQVTGVDIGESHLRVAREEALRQGIANAEFQVADLLALPFGEACFDAVLMHTVLDHVGDVAGALAQARRVLRPGGVLGIRSMDRRGILHWPEDASTRTAYDLLWRRMELAGGGASRGTSMGAALVAAGFAVLDVVPSYYVGSRERTARSLEGDMGAHFISAGFVDAPGLAALIRGLREAARAPGAFLAIPMIGVVGRKPA